jgi:putative hydrolase of the HAD superfamily
MTQRSTIEAVLLDVGGTLLSEHPPRASIYARAGRERGLAVSDAEMRSLMHRTARALPRRVEGQFRYSGAWFMRFMRRLFVDALGLDPSALPELQDELFARFADPATFRLYPGALELLDSLRARGLTLGIVSNWSEALPGILEGLGVGRRVDFVLTSAIEGCEKPEAEIFRRALERAGAAPERTVHAGNDLELDVRGAIGSGILPVLVDHGRRGTWPRDVDLVGDLFELEQWIAERID